MAIVNYEDEFDLPPVDYDRNKVPKSIKDRAEGVLDAIFGKQNKEFLAQSVEISGLLSAEAKSSAAQISVKQNSLEQRFLTLQQETTNGYYDSAPEIIDARGGKATLGQRLDETTAQLAQNMKVISHGSSYVDKLEKLINIKGMYVRSDGSDVFVGVGMSNGLDSVVEYQFRYNDDGLLLLRGVKSGLENKNTLVR